MLKLPPYVCNGCTRYLNKTCTKHYEIYCSNIANEKSFSRKSAANIKNIDKRIEIVKLLNDLLSKKQTIGHIHSVLVVEPGVFVDYKFNNKLKVYTSLDMPFIFKTRNEKNLEIKKQVFEQVEYQKIQKEDVFLPNNFNIKLGLGMKYTF